MRFMKKIGHSFRHWLLACASGLYVVVPSVGMAASAPGELSQVPLFLAQAVPPNIMIVLDDSGSMRGTRVGGNDDIPPGSAPLDSLCGNGLAYNPSKTYTPWKGEDANGDAFADADPARARAYPWEDPAQTGTTNLLASSAYWDTSRDVSGQTWADFNYTFGVNGWELEYPPNSGNMLVLNDIGFPPALSNSGNTQWGAWDGATRSFTNPSVSANPQNLRFRPSDGALRVIANARRYYIWNDSNNNGKADRFECTTSGFVAALPFAGSRSNPNSQTNYANWYTYYRSRELVMRKAISEVVWTSKERLGLSGINLRFTRDAAGNPRAGGAGIEIKDMDDLTVGKPAADIAIARANKKALLQNLFQMVSNGNTPLRRALDNAGRYYAHLEQMGTKGLFGSGNKRPSQPFLSVADGGECQQNFTLLFSDGQRNASFPTSLFTDPDTSPSSTGAPYFNGGSFGDSIPRTLADIAMYYYQQDFSTMANRVAPTFLTESDTSGGFTRNAHRVDNNPGQHMVTYTIAFGLSGVVDPLTQPADATQPFSGWNVPTNNPSTAQSADDMYHAAWNGRGRYLSAKDADGLISALKSVFRDIQERTGAAAAAVAVTSTTVQGGGKVFQAGFDSTHWTGSLSAYTVNASGIGSTPLWDADDLLAARDMNSNPRTLLTYNGSQGVEFKMPADYTSPAANELHPDQIADLLVNAPASGAARTAFLSDLIDYFHGDGSNEGANAQGFRERNGHVLGDIIHSAPVFVGKPVSPVQTTSYQTWANAAARVNRTQVVYVGSNDGMLHAFNAATGEELFAYIPKLLFSSDNRLGLHWLAQADYEHRYYVDQTIAAGDAYFGGDWHTVLVGGLRGGGKGLFALDITDPDALAAPSTGASKVLWEFNQPDMGFSYAQPTIVQLNNAAQDWAVIVGNGYDNTGDGRAKIFVIKLSDGSVIATLDSGVGTAVNSDCSDPASDCNGMSSPVVADINGDGRADRVYAGDVKGNLWTFDLTNATESTWNGTKRKLFTATTAPGQSVAPTTGGAPAAITAQPSVAKHPYMRDESTAPNLLVSFSSGQLIAVDDESDATKHSFYTVWDDGSSSPKTRSDLVEQTITTTTKTVGGATFDVRLLSHNLVDYSAATNPDKGWYIDYVEDGERGITTPLLFGDLVVWTTLTPKAAGPTSNKCDSAGESWLMVANYATGAEPAFIALDVDGNGTFNGDDVVGGQNVSGVHSGDIYWQPTIVTGDHGAGIVLLPVDTTGGANVESRSIQGISQKGLRSAWGRFNF